MVSWANRQGGTGLCEACERPWDDHGHDTSTGPSRDCRFVLGPKLPQVAR